MSSISGEKTASSPDAQTVALENKLVVATHRGEGGCHGDGCGDRDEEAAMATSKKPSKEDQSINPLLLGSACVGSWEQLNVFLEREDAKIPPMLASQEYLELVERGSSAEGKSSASATGDVEEGVHHQPALLAAGVLLKGVTPDGNTALHVVASNGDGNNFLKYAGMICNRDRDLLFAKNHRGDTALHCAARAGYFEMASHLIDLAGHEGPDRKLTFLRMENDRHETALHDAIRIEEGRILGSKDREALFDADGAPEERIRAFVDQQEERTIVKLLMGADSELANYPADGISPMYLAILLGKSTIAVTLYDRSGGNLSYSGADGQNALHGAVLQNTDTVMMELILHWNKSITTQVDNDGSTPLHFVSPMYTPRSGLFLLIQPFNRLPWCHIPWFNWFIYALALPIVYKANPAALYQADKKGFFPIHVAASVGATGIIDFFLRLHPDIASLRDAKGKTFLHVATEEGAMQLVQYVCGKPSLAWILNMQDNDGNTALHLAIQAGNLMLFSALLGNRKVNLDLTNNQGDTPLDVSISKIPSGLVYGGNSENMISYALKSVSAKLSAFRWDKFNERYSRRPKAEQEEKELERVKDATQTFIVASVLITTMAFSATFAVPGGYRADDHTNGGTPTLAGRYIFDAFMMATALAFICSSLATVGFIYAGTPIVNLATRKMYIRKSAPLMASSVTCLCLAFALAVYMVLAPVARNTAIAVCVIISGVPLYVYSDGLQIMFILARPIFIRNGLKLGMKQLLQQGGVMTVYVLLPFILTFGWATLARIHHHG